MCVCAWDIIGTQLRSHAELTTEVAWARWWYLHTCNTAVEIHCITGQLKHGSFITCLCMERTWWVSVIIKWLILYSWLAFNCC